MLHPFIIGFNGALRPLDTGWETNWAAGSHKSLLVPVKHQLHPLVVGNKEQGHGNKGTRKKLEKYFHLDLETVCLVITDHFRVSFVSKSYSMRM